jgi:hypothetical protein
MRSTIAVVSLLLLLNARPVAAQQPGTPDPAAMAQMFSQMTPMYEGMSQAMIEGTLKALEKPETVDRLARFAKRYYDALIKQGFSKEEALQIVAGAGVVGTQTPR